MCTCSLYSGWHQKKSGHRVDRTDSALLLHSHDTPYGLLHPTLQTAAFRRTVRVGPEEVPQDDWRAIAFLLGVKAERVVVVHSREDKTPGRLY